MNVSEFLALRDVLVGLDPADKTALLQRLAQQAAGELDLKTADVATALFDREKLGSTGTGAGIAIPHARMRQVTRPIEEQGKFIQVGAFLGISSGEAADISIPDFHASRQRCRKKRTYDERPTSAVTLS